MSERAVLSPEALCLTPVRFCTVHRKPGVSVGCRPTTDGEGDDSESFTGNPVCEPSPYGSPRRMSVMHRVSRPRPSFAVRLLHHPSSSSLSVSPRLVCFPRLSSVFLPLPSRRLPVPERPVLERLVSPETRCAWPRIRLRPTGFGTNVGTTAVSAETRCVQRKHGVSPPLSPDRFAVRPVTSSLSDNSGAATTAPHPRHRQFNYRGNGTRG